MRSRTQTDYLTVYGFDFVGLYANDRVSAVTVTIYRRSARKVCVWLRFLLSFLGLPHNDFIDDTYRRFLRLAPIRASL